MNWLCRFGIHDYDNWSEVVMFEFILRGGRASYPAQVTFCKKCNKRKVVMV